MHTRSVEYMKEALCKVATLKWWSIPVSAVYHCWHNQLIGKGASESERERCAIPPQSWLYEWALWSSGWPHYSSPSHNIDYSCVHITTLPLFPHTSIITMTYGVVSCFILSPALSLSPSLPPPLSQPLINVALMSCIVYLYEGLIDLLPTNR